MSVTGSRLQPTIFELSRPGRGGGKLPAPPSDALDRVPAGQRRAAPPLLPELNEPEVVRHYVNLSQLNHAVDTGFYPLGSCTMKYNPKIDEWAARIPGFAQLHPLAPDATAQGTLQMLWELEQALVEISGMAEVSLHPAAGAQGELTGILMIRAYHRSRGDTDRDEVLVPDSSHGTNPATATMAGYSPENIKLSEADSSGQMNLEQERSLVTEYGLGDAVLLAATERVSDEDIEALAAALGEVGARRETAVAHG
jgi:glycine dehydrogenase subunit 2